MRKLLVILGCSLAAGCAEAPQSYDLISMEKTEHRFIPPPAEDRSARTTQMLRKTELNLQEVLEIADSLNPELEIERKNIDLATADIWEASLYPNPSGRFDIEEQRLNGGSSKKTLGVSVPIVIGGRIDAAISMTAKQREVAALRYVWHRREVLSAVKRAFVDVLATGTNADLARETRDIARSLHDVTNERFKAQAIPEMELLKAAVNLAKAETDLRLAEKNQSMGIKALHALMGNVDFPTEKFVGELFTKFTLPSFEVLRGQVATVHPLLEEAAKTREAAELELALARAEKTPDIAVEFSAGVNSDNEAIVQGGIEIPFPLFNRNQAKVQRAEVRIRQAELQTQAVKNDLALRLTDAYKTLVSAQDRVLVYKDEILPKALKALDQTNEGYKQGKFGYLDVLDAQRTLGDAKIAYAASLADLNSAAVELEKLTGMKLEPIR